MAVIQKSDDTWKIAALLASTTNVPVNSVLPIIDGIQTQHGNRILLKDQTDPTENGIYVVQSMTLAKDSDNNVAWAFVNGGIVRVLGGSTNLNTEWYIAPISAADYPTASKVFTTSPFGGGGGTTYTASNGLTMSGSDIQFGGSLTAPVTLDALGANTFSITDQAGLMFQTRDANGNFLMNNIGGNATLIGSNTYIFSYLGDGGNTFTDSLIVINFGGANILTRVTDFWNFGDYTQATDSNAMFNIGRFNQYTNVSTATILGYSNNVSNSSSITVIGTGNVISTQSDKFFLGNNNKNLVIDGTTGNVGIGETSPTAKLHVAGIDSTSGNYAVKINNSTTTLMYMRNDGFIFAGDYSLNTIFHTYGQGGTLGFSNESSNMSLLTAASDNKFYFTNGINWADNYAQIKTSNGNWFIGSPNAGVHSESLIDTKFHIKGIDSTSSNYALKVDNSASTNLLSISNNGLHVFGSILDGSSSGINNFEYSTTSGSTRSAYYGATGISTIFDFYTNGVKNTVVDEFSGYYAISTRNRFSIKTFDGVPHFWMDGTTNGWIGVGNSYFTPDATLHVQGISATSSNYALKVDNSSALPLLYVANNGSIGINSGIDALYTLTIGSKVTGAIRMFNSSFANMLTVTDTGLYNFSGATRMGIGAAATSNTNFFIEAFSALTTDYSLHIASVNSLSTIFTVRNDGNVGIGTASPTSKLNVVGGTYLQLNDTVFRVDVGGSAGQVLFYRSADISFMMNPYPSAFNTSFRFLSNPAGTSYEAGIENTVKAELTNTGNLIGEVLNIGSTGSFTGNIYGKYIQKSNFLNTNATFYPLVAMGGSVGIGTTTPTALLEVNGDIKTAQPSANGAGAWKLGKKVTATVSLVTTDYIEVDIDGVVYKLALVS
jgi:hypothetical protein